MKDKICFSKTFTYLVLLIGVVAGFFLVMNKANTAKFGLTPKAGGPCDSTIQCQQKISGTVASFKQYYFKNGQKYVEGTCTIPMSTTESQYCTSEIRFCDTTGHKYTQTDSSYFHFTSKLAALFEKPEYCRGVLSAIEYSCQQSVPGFPADYDVKYYMKSHHGIIGYSDAKTPDKNYYEDPNLRYVINQFNGIGNYCKYMYNQWAAKQKPTPIPLKVENPSNYSCLTQSCVTINPTNGQYQKGQSVSFKREDRDKIEFEKTYYYPNTACQSLMAPSDPSKKGELAYTTYTNWCKGGTQTGATVAPNQFIANKNCKQFDCSTAGSTTTYETTSDGRRLANAVPTIIPAVAGRKYYVKDKVYYDNPGCTQKIVDHVGVGNYCRAVPVKFGCYEWWLDYTDRKTIPPSVVKSNAGEISTTDNGVTWRAPSTVNSQNYVGAGYAGAGRELWNLTFGEATWYSLSLRTGRDIKYYCTLLQPTAIPTGVRPTSAVTQ